MDGDRRIIRDGALAIDGDRIAAVGKTADVARGFTADTTLHADGKLVLPGLVDTHVHNTQQLGRGLADECDIPVQLLERLYGYEKEMTPEDAYWAALLCQLELIKAGTTCFIDPSSYYPGETARAVATSGLRGIVARTAFDIHETPIGSLPDTMFRETTDEAVAKAREVVIAHHGPRDPLDVVGRDRARVAALVVRWRDREVPREGPALAANGFRLDAYGEGRFSSSWWQAVRSDRRPRPLDLALRAGFAVYDLIPFRKDVMVVRARRVGVGAP